MNQPAGNFNRGHRRFIRYVPLILWIGLIFLLSSSQGSMTRTSIFIGPLLKFLFPEAPEDVIAVYHGYIRKFAHFSVYAVLAFWSWFAFRVSAKDVLRHHWFPASLLLVGVVASLDEFNQSFLDTRTGSAFDVLIDLSGGLVMLTLILILSKLGNRRRSLV